MKTVDLLTLIHDHIETYDYEWLEELQEETPNYEIEGRKVRLYVESTANN